MFLRNTFLSPGIGLEILQALLPHRPARPASVRRDDCRPAPFWQLISAMFYLFLSKDTSYGAVPLLLTSRLEKIQHKFYLGWRAIFDNHSFPTLHHTMIYYNIFRSAVWKNVAFSMTFPSSTRLSVGEQTPPTCSDASRSTYLSVESGLDHLSCSTLP